MREMQSQADGRIKSPPIVSLLIRTNGFEIETREGLSSMRFEIELYDMIDSKFCKKY
jgi:hypothetical protein